jgi:hypothetical protein
VDPEVSVVEELLPATTVLPPAVEEPLPATTFRPVCEPEEVVEIVTVLVCGGNVTVAPVAVRPGTVTVIVVICAQAIQTNTATTRRDLLKRCIFDNG